MKDIILINPAPIEPKKAPQSKEGKGTITINKGDDQNDTAKK